MANMGDITHMLWEGISLALLTGWAALTVVERRRRTRRTKMALRNQVIRRRRIILDAANSFDWRVRHGR
jgi:cytochrome c-type biogenesis protein CcmH/NrfF